MKSRYQDIGKKISIFISLISLLISFLFLLTPLVAVQLFFSFHPKQDTNDQLSNLELSLSLLFGGILASFSLMTILLSWKSWPPNLDVQSPLIKTECELYHSRVALGAQSISGFMCVIAILTYARRIHGTENSELASGKFAAYFAVAGGCLLMILASIGLMASLVTFADNVEPIDFMMNDIEQLETETERFEDLNINTPPRRTRILCWKLFNNSSDISASNLRAAFEEDSDNRIPLLPIQRDEEQNNPDSSQQINNRLKGTRRILQLASPQKLTLFLGCFVLLIRLPFSLSIPHLVSSTIGSLGRSDFAGAKESIVLIFILGTIDAILDFWCVYLFGGAKERMVKSLRMDTFKAILGQEMSFFDSVHTGELTSRLTSDCGEMAGDLTWFFRFSIEATVRITGISLYMLIRCPPLGCTALSIIPVVALVNKKYGNWLAKNATDVQNALAEANNVAQEAFSCIRTVIAFASEDVEYDKYGAKIDAHFRLNMRQLFATGIYFMVVSTFFINTCIQATLLFVGSNLIKQDRLTAEVLLAFMLYQGQLQEYTLQFFQSYTSLIKSSGAGEKVFALLDRKPNPPGTDFANSFDSTPSNLNQSTAFTIREQLDINNKINDAMAIKREISLCHIHFTYPLRPTQTILNNLNLTIPSGSTVALVGPSGCGKSTIVSLLERFYDPCLGRVMIDGIDLRNLNVRDYRRKVGIVAQDPVLFSGTIMSNIVYGAPCTARSEAIEAAKLANVDSFVKGFPQGYETNVGEKGVQLSGGQKQRLAIARAMAKKPSLLLLDEATSALDQESERLVQIAIDTLLHNRNWGSISPRAHSMTTVVVAHRLQTVRNADWIVVMQPGLGIVESGSHDDLVQKTDGYYRRMIENSNSNGTFMDV